MSIALNILVTCLSALYIRSIVWSINSISHSVLSHLRAWSFVWKCEMVSLCHINFAWTCACYKHFESKCREVQIIAVLMVLTAKAHRMLLVRIVMYYLSRNDSSRNFSISELVCLSHVACTGHSMGGNLCDLFAACANSKRILPEISFSANKYSTENADMLD